MNDTNRPYVLTIWRRHPDGTESVEETERYPYLSGAQRMKVAHEEDLDPKRYRVTVSGPLLEGGAG